MKKWFIAGLTVTLAFGVWADEVITGSIITTNNVGTNVLSGAVREGFGTEASGALSHAEGFGSRAKGYAAHAEGASEASGAFSHSAGYNASATNDNTYVWSDGKSVGSTTSNQFTVHAANGIRLLGGPISGNGSGLTNLNVIAAFPTSGVWNAAGLTITNVNLAGGIQVSGSALTISTNLDMAGHKILNLGAAVSDTDAASQGRVKTMMQQVPEYGDLSMGDFTSQVGMPDRSIPAVIHTEDLADGAVTLAKINADASEDARGLVERATDAEVALGVDTNRYITPKQLFDLLKPNIVQAVKSNMDNILSSGDTNWVHIGNLCVGITPRHSNSLVRVTAVIHGTSNDEFSPVQLRLLRNFSTPIGVGDIAGSHLQCSTQLQNATKERNVSVANIDYIDNPNSTNLLSYSVEMAVRSGKRIYINRDSTYSDDNTYGRFISTITAEEILR